MGKITLNIEINNVPDNYCNNIDIGAKIKISDYCEDLEITRFDIKKNIKPLYGCGPKPVAIEKKGFDIYVEGFTNFKE